MSRPPAEANDSVVAIGITNQRETLVASTVLREPPAIGPSCGRTAGPPPGAAG